MTSPTVSQQDERDGPSRQSSDAPVVWFTWTVPKATEPDSARRLLFLDDDPVRAEAFLIENPQAIWVQTVAECIDKLSENWDEIHLDHDLGGKTFVDVNETDCGMEVIRWLCREPREHLRTAQFFIHTHNTLAGMLMVLQMKESGYSAEFRPFGLNPLLLLRRDEDDESRAAEQPLAMETPAERPAPPGAFRSLIGSLTRFWRLGRPRNE
jgi:hypothetical protein